MARPRRTSSLVTALLVAALAGAAFVPAFRAESSTKVALRAEGKKRLTLQEVREKEMMKEAAQVKEMQESAERNKYQPGTYVPDDKKEVYEDNPVIFLAPLAAWSLVAGGLYFYANFMNTPKDNFSLLPPELRG
ncbi:unnamed protein product [Effrenium voratum]|uniref:Uncharacterized protein n=1 Tax=Effrenium voratum TaxID=2562239 RepID=A0AA36I602_9DINO|nr:unnamed protein product [Effrenium voratum]CAJ1429609.1 unnamed protein product [Effrenium voratum]